VKKPEQIPLDLSESLNTTGVGKRTNAEVVRLSDYRVEQRKPMSLSAVYEAIHESIKHINVRRRLNAQAFTDSKFR
jgi:hypothetical protein